MKKGTKTKSAPRRAPAPKASIDVVGELEAATQAFAAGAFGDAIVHVIAAWTAAPTERLGPIALAIDRRLPRQELPAKVSAREAAWLKLAKSHHPKALPTLLGCDWPPHPREAKARLSELVEFAPDPRIAEAVFALRAAKRYTSNAGNAFWKLAFLTVGRWGDPRVALAAAAAKTSQTIDWWSVIDPVIKKLEKLPGPVALDAAAEKALAALEAAVAAQKPSSGVDLKTLFAAVYDDPASDAPRLVLADALLAEDDPRGELIQLQLSGKPKTASRIKALLRAHGPTWLDGIEGVPVFRRGFVAEVVLPAPIENPPRSWRTVENIGFFSSPAPKAFAPFITHDHLETVRAVANVSLACVAAMVGRRLDSLRVIGGLTKLAAAPEVRDLWIGLEPGNAVTAALQWFAASPFAASCEHVIVDAPESTLAEAIAWFRTAGTPRLSLRPTMNHRPIAWELELGREGKGLALTAIWQGNTYGEREVSGLGQAISALEATALSRFVAKANAKLEASVQRAVADEITNALRRQTALAKPSIFE